MRGQSRATKGTQAGGQSGPRRPWRRESQCASGSEAPSLQSRPLCQGQQQALELEPWESLETRPVPKPLGDPTEKAGCVVLGGCPPGIKAVMTAFSKLLVEEVSPSAWRAALRWGGRKDAAPRGHVRGLRARGRSGSRVQVGRAVSLTLCDLSVLEDGHLLPGCHPGSSNAQTGS